MKSCWRCVRWDVIGPAVFAWMLAGSTAVHAAGPSRPLDLVPFGQLSGWAGPKSGHGTELKSLKALPAESRCVGVVWHEARDVREIRARFAGSAQVAGVAVEYWFHTWPGPPPVGPTIEDPLDDPWQGEWLTAQVERGFRDGVNIFSFKPLNSSENRRAHNLPGVTYRRTLKVRLVLPAGGPRLESLEMSSDTVLKPLAFRIEFGCGEKSPTRWDGKLEIFNGILVSARPWGFEGQDRFEPPFSWRGVATGYPKGIVAEVLASSPSPPGSNDITVVTVQAQGDRHIFRPLGVYQGSGETGRKMSQSPANRTFSFSTLDLERGPIYVPDLCALVAKVDDPRHFSADYPARGRTIRDEIPHEPEQTFQRASREIPPLDPWVRQNGDRVYLPVAADASWQKFAVEYGGDVFFGKSETKAKGAELKRLQWPGDVIRFRLGTMRAGAGAVPYYREDHKAQVAIAEDCLPIVINRWQCDGLHYEEEAFATLLEGPLDPNDPRRSEQTPAVLMMQLRVHNPGNEAARAACVLSIEPREKLLLANHRVYAQADARRLRMVVLPPTGAETRLADNRVVAQFGVPAGGMETLAVCIPFVSDLGDDDAARLESLGYARQRQRVADYWRAMIAKTTRFTTPEPQFNDLARALIPHIHISTTKDPKSGLYMVPAASFGYQLFANECCFQVLLLDALGDTQRATQYLKTLTELQGSRSFPGNYLEPHDGVLHGARVDDEYDYTAHNYGLDHGTVLWTLARHYFYTRDAEWLKATLPHMLKAVEWIERQRATTKKTDLQGNRVLEYGLLPAGHLEDNSDWGYWFSVNAYCVAGMIDMAAAMREIYHPDAERLGRQAAAYRDDFRAAVVRATELTPVVRMRDGTYSPCVPTRPYQRFRYFGPLRVQYYSRYHRPIGDRPMCSANASSAKSVLAPKNGPVPVPKGDRSMFSANASSANSVLWPKNGPVPCFRLSATREVLYGPMIFLNLGLFDPQSPLANWVLDDWEDNLTLSSSGGFNVHGFTDDRYWFSQGGMVFQANLQNPILVYLERNEIPAAIRGIYNGLVACLYPEVHALTEEFREWQHASGPFYKSPDEARLVNRIRDMLVLEAGDDLLLAAGVPRRWLASGPGVRVDRVNSLFGPVGFSMRAERNTQKGTVPFLWPPATKIGTVPRKIVIAHVKPPTRNPPKHLWLCVRLPEGKQIAAVEINGRPWKNFDARRERIELPQSGKPLDIVIHP